MQPANEQIPFTPADLELLRIVLGGASIHDLVDLLRQTGFLSDEIKEEVRKFEESGGQTDPGTPGEALPTKTAKERLAEKVKANFAEFKETWLSLSPEQLIAQCEEIEAVTRMAHDAPMSVNEEDAVFLLRFKNPLEVVSDQWVSRNGMGSLVIDDELDDILWTLRDRDEIDCYELEEESPRENPSQTM